jgi:hypothetical protein
MEVREHAHLNLFSFWHKFTEISFIVSVCGTISCSLVKHFAFTLNINALNPTHSYLSALVPSYQQMIATSH